MNIVAIVQARMTSSRLKGKVLLKVGGRLVLEHVVIRLKSSNLINNVVVATTFDYEDDQIVNWANVNSTDYFRGDKKDVLSRFYNCAMQYAADVIVRVTSDNPLLDPKIVDQTISEFLSSEADFTSNNLIKTFPWGLDVEVISVNALKIAYEEAKTSSDREHVTQFLRHRPKRFKLVNVKAPENNHNIRITLDEESDLILIEKIFNILGDKADYQSIINLFKTNSELININLQTRLLHDKYNDSLNLI